jgi:sterol desaturase/sphingolipid hydroxylase (fatty acid hydroxylase superfamily)
MPLAIGARELLTQVAVVVAVMAAAAALELVLPLFPPGPAARPRRATNLAMTALTFAANWAMTSAAAVLALALPLRAPGFLARLGVPLAAQIVGGAVLLDFSFGYLAHRAMHASPLLWRVHRVHHSDPFVDVTTTYRNHPLEGLWRFLFVIGPVWVLGLPAEAVVLHRLLSSLNAIVEHANLRLWRPLERAVSLIWVTPDVHKVHHSRVCAETDSNYGNVLAIHDRLLRTFTPGGRARTVRYGLDDVDPTRAASLPALLALPFAAADVPAGTGAPRERVRARAAPDATPATPAAP